MLQEIINRLQGPTPKFWRKVRRFGAFLTTAGAAMVAAPAGLPAWIAMAGGYVTVAGGVVVGLASLACEDTSETNAPGAPQL